LRGRKSRFQSPLHSHPLRKVWDSIDLLTKSLKTLAQSDDAEALLRKAASSLNACLRFHDKGNLTCFYTGKGITPRPKLRRRSLFCEGYRAPLPHCSDSDPNFLNQSPHMTRKRGMTLPMHTKLKIEFLPFATNIGPLTPEDVLGALSSIGNFDTSLIVSPIQLLPHP
jgi:hypothetical protein